MTGPACYIQSLNVVENYSHIFTQYLSVEIVFSVLNTAQISMKTVYISCIKSKMTKDNWS